MRAVTSRSVGRGVQSARIAMLDERYQSAGRTDLLLRPARAQALAERAAHAGDGHPLPEPRCDRALLSSLRGAVRVRRRVGTGADACSARCSRATTRPIDDAIGRAIARLGPDDLLLVVSGYGMEPLGFGKRMLERLIGDPEISGTHETAPDGFLMAYGASVAKGRLRRASVVDVVPTLLYFLGPADRPRHGRVRPDRSVPTEFTEERPIAFIPTYDR